MTGANSGGEAAEIALGRTGADVVASYATVAERTAKMVEEISRSGARVFARQADVSREEEVQQMFRRAVTEFGEPEDIGRVVIWLVSDEPDYVIGATLSVDGGMTLFLDFAEGG
ncbi:MAG: SDR family oxidoreductase [Stellaceae bacterium]